MWESALSISPFTPPASVAADLMRLPSERFSGRVRIRLDWRSSTSSACVSGCTTGVQDTHKTYIREVRYPWHPWYGEQVYVRCEVRLGGMIVLPCIHDELNWAAALEIPEWMFDSSRCSQVEAEHLAHVGVSALRALCVLVSLRADRIESREVQAQHSPRDSGGADADHIPVQGPAGPVVYSATTTTEASPGGPSAGASPIGSDDERAHRKEPSFPGAIGGGR